MTVYHLKSAPVDAVRIDRQTRWGNPFHISGSMDRAAVIRAYENYVTAPEQSDLLAAMRQELTGRDLACWCAPLPCHGDVINRLVNGPD